MKRDQRALVATIARVAEEWRDPEHVLRQESVARTLDAGNRFTEEALAFAINQQMAIMTEEGLMAWIAGRHTDSPCEVGVLNAGNIPLVGLQDFLAVVLTGHRYLGTRSSRSPVLLPAFVDAVRGRAGGLEACFAPAKEMWEEADAVIATGSDSTLVWVKGETQRHGIAASRCLLRGHRYGVAVLDGHETQTDRDNLAEDALLHEGLGCRSIAMIWAPKELSPDPYLESFAAFRGVFPPHAETPGALSMQKAFLDALSLPHAYGEGLEFLLSRGAPEPQGPGHVRWVDYDSLGEVVDFLTAHTHALQLVAARPALLETLPAALPLIALGEAQRPPLDWLPDGLNTVAFLCAL